VANPRGATDALDREARQIMAVVDQIRRLLIDCTVEEKRLILIEVDKCVAMEETSHATPQ
jgi:hypothetical protein